jgi:catechol 2,3-dioxygenase-like lactoylglutathione lyase family enzyme
MALQVLANQHVGITVSDLGRSLRFYKEVFGVDPDFVVDDDDTSQGEAVGVPSPRMRVAVLTLAKNVQVELLQYVEPTGAPYTLRNCDVGAMHMCLTVEDIDVAYDELSARGAPPLARPRFERSASDPDGWKWFYCKDPDGITIEFVELLGASQEPAAEGS